MKNTLYPILFVMLLSSNAFGWGWGGSLSTGKKLEIVLSDITTYSASNTYTKNATVSYNGEAWLAVQEVPTNQTPAIGSSYWTKIIAQGPSGTPGAAGSNGVNGVNGQDGQAAVITIGNVVTLPSGSPVAVSNRGTSSSAVLDFSIPRGANGVGISEGSDGVYGWLTSTNSSNYSECTSGVYGLNFIGGTLYQCKNGVNSVFATGDTLPSQPGHSGKYLTTNGTSTSWSTVNSLPSQTGHSGKYLTSNGSEASWATIATGGSNYTSVPTYSDSLCTAGQYALSSTYRYDCVATNTWTRTSLTAWSNLTPSGTPTFSSFTIGSSGTSMTVVLSESTTVGAGGNGGMAVTCSTAGSVTATYSSGSPGTSYVYTLGTTVNAGETCTATYTQPGNGLEATSGGNDVVTVNNTGIINQSSQGVIGSETVVPSAVTGGWTKMGAVSNLVTLTDDDDATYFTYSSTSASLQMSMPQPTGNPATVKFCARLSESGTNNPASRFRLFNSGTSSYQSFTPDPITVTTGETYTEYCTDATATNPVTGTAWTKENFAAYTWVINTGATGSIVLNCSKAWAVVTY